MEKLLEPFTYPFMLQAMAVGVIVGEFPGFPGKHWAHSPTSRALELLRSYLRFATLLSGDSATARAFSDA